jgi:hypothetical protein
LVESDAAVGCSVAEWRDSVAGEPQDRREVTEVTTTTESTTSTWADHGRATTARPEQGLGRAALDSAAYVLRQLAGCLVIVACVWLAVMLFRHLQPVALVLAALVLAVGGVTLFVRNRSISRAD